MATSVIETRHVRIPMRDGVGLAADIWRPDTDQPVPVLVSRTPYGKAMIALMSAPAELAAAGFAVVLQDCRGRFGSEGEWGYVQCEVEDGYDTVEWAAGRAWSNSRVGMFGASYMGYTQWLAAVAASSAPRGHGSRVLCRRLLGGVVRSRRHVPAGPTARAGRRR